MVLSAATTSPTSVRFPSRRHRTDHRVFNMASHVGNDPVDSLNRRRDSPPVVCQHARRTNGSSCRCRRGASCSRAEIEYER
jgi:hypothetical protein